MPDLLADIGRIWLAVAYAVFGLIIIVFPVRNHRIAGWALAAVAFVASGVTLLHSVIVKLPGWPAAISALFVTLVALHIFRHAIIHRED